jgi:prolyl oligopeptidase
VKLQIVVMIIAVSLLTATKGAPDSNAVGGTRVAADRSAAAQSAPPVAPVRVVTDDYFGTKVDDPYRYMEDLKNPEVQAWFKAQNNYTRDVLARVPGRQRLLARITELDESAPANVSAVKRLSNGRYFYEKSLAKDSVPKLYMRDGLQAAERMLVDPASYVDAGGHHSFLSFYQPSFDGHYVLAGLSAGGSEGSVIHIIDAATRKETGETIDRSRFANPSWLPDGHSFLHNRMQEMAPGIPPTETELKSKVYLHVLGTDPAKDPAVFGYGVSPRVSFLPIDVPSVATYPGSPYAFGIISHGVDFNLTIYVAPLESLTKADIPWTKICDVEDQIMGFAPHGDEIYLRSHKDAPRFKVVRTSMVHPDPAHAQVVVPPGEDVIKSIALAEDALYVKSLSGVVSRLLRVPFSGPEAGKPQQADLPFAGTLSVESADPRIPGILFGFTSWTKAYSVYVYDPQTKQVTELGLQPHGPFDNPQDVVSEEVKAVSYDGTLVPLSIVHKRGIKLDGSNPTQLFGYGAYGIMLEPSFDPTRLAWIESGGILAEAQVRGGGVYGEEWHLAGQKLTKHNTWQDFIACAQYLINHGYTSPAHLAGGGGSAGGITVGRAITERPELFAAAVDIVGVSDSLRMEQEPNGAPNIPEFGSTRTPEGFKGLYEMSPYHHVKDGTAYPAVMFMTGINDPRVAPWQMAKMTARMQAATSSGKPILLRVDYDAGHGTNSATRSQRGEFYADMWSFLLWQLGAPGFQLPAQTDKNEPIQKELLDWAGQNLHPIESVGPNARLSDLEPLRDMIGNAAVVSLGEGLHGGAEPLEFRNLLFRFLVEKMGFNGIAIESGIVEGFTVSKYVLGEPGDLKTVVSRGFTDGFDKLPQEASLVQWMRAYNDDPKHARKIHFYGLDVSASDGQSQLPLREALRYLDAVDADAATSLRNRLSPIISRLAFSRFDDSPYPHLTQAERDLVTGTIADMISLFEIRQAQYTAATSDRAYQLAYQTAIAARQVDTYVRQVPVGWSPKDGVLSTIGTGAAADRIKTDNVRWIRQQLGEDGKLLVFAHRDHIATAPLTLHFPPDNPFNLPPTIVYPPLMGSYLKPLYGKRLVTIGNLLAEDLSQCKTKRARAASGTLEALMSELNKPFFVLDLRTAPPKVAAWLAQLHTLYGLNFADALEVGKSFDIIFFSKTVTPAAPCP